ncbi:MAG: hypothetical protein DRI84_01390 [Bacteroidetes bacterium]|nr:MAG: hypothetical protein DRI84_01390 [Bacteroidota bacterium]
MKHIYILSIALLFSLSTFAGNKSSLDSPTLPSYDENFLLPGGFFNVNYNLSWGVGDFKEFISKTSYRGFSLDARWFVSDRIAIGTMFGWNGFYEKYPIKTYEFDGGALTGVVQSTYYNFTMSINAYYYPFPEAMIKPYIGVNVGPEYQTLDIQIGRVYSEHETWQFLVAPELGTFIQFGENSDVGANLAIRYNYINYTNTNLGFNSGLTYLQAVFGLSFMF